jgi:hypothetical protein
MTPAQWNYYGDALYRALRSRTPIEPLTAQEP